MTHDKWANPQKMWDERFAKPDPVYGEAPNAFLREQASHWKPGARVLVPGDGYGRNGVWLARQGFHVHTVDLSPVGVERSRATAQAAGLQMKIECADLARWNWPTGEFDVVAAIFVHLPPEIRPNIHASMLRTLKPGGILVLEAFSPAQLQYTSGGPKTVELLYTAEILRRDFAGGEVIKLIEEVAELEEGPMHSGPGAVVRGIFRRV
jgi:2-polyprenyl-3-methyl-5-hydroxy-6-metoxy-1,4-benzoquinol methylase